VKAGRFPFPHARYCDRCTYATGVGADDVRAAYATWKEQLVTADGAAPFLRVRRTEPPGAAAGSTVSEGIAYGMILAVMMDDRPLFDGLWGYACRWSDRNGLMHWSIDAAGAGTLQTGAATDADQDMAWSLVMAGRQWGGPAAAAHYRSEAMRQIDRIWRHEVDHAQARRGLLLPGDSWGGRAIPFNPSYFAPSHYRLFGAISGHRAGWAEVVDRGYAIIEKAQDAARGNGDNGLVPAWCDPDGVPIQRPPPDDGAARTGYQYDAARVPFRLAQDWCYHGEPRARATLARNSAFFAALGAARITDGYDLDGTPRPEAPGGRPSAVFVGGAVAGAMHDPRYQGFIDEAARLLASGRLIGKSRYYDLTWTVLALLMLTGNLIELPE
jgi:endo-1,4-beta-D-glucanase Y